MAGLAGTIRLFLGEAEHVFVAVGDLAHRGGGGGVVGGSGVDIAPQTHVRGAEDGVHVLVHEGGAGGHVVIEQEFLAWGHGDDVDGALVVEVVLVQADGRRGVEGQGIDDLGHAGALEVLAAVEDDGALLLLLAGLVFLQDAGELAVAVGDLGVGGRGAGCWAVAEDGGEVRV